MTRRPAIGRLCVITDTAVQSRFDHTTLAELACRGGADMIQLRDKTLPDDALIPIAIEVRHVCHRHGAMFIVNDRVAVARASGAHGVHLGRGDMSIADARRLLGEGAIIGATAHSLEEAVEADGSAADYMGFGHVFPTASKKKATSPVGIDELARVCAAVSKPVLAIGGITHDRIAAVMASGAWGIAVIAEVCTAGDPRAATERVRRALDSTR